MEDAKQQNAFKNRECKWIFFFLQHLPNILNCKLKFNSFLFFISSFLLQGKIFSLPFPTVSADIFLKCKWLHFFTSRKFINEKKKMTIIEEKYAVSICVCVFIKKIRVFNLHSLDIITWKKIWRNGQPKEK